MTDTDMQREESPTDRKPLAIEVYQVGERLQINADVGIDDFEKLEKMLAKYKEILGLFKEPPPPV